MCMFLSLWVISRNHIQYNISNVSTSGVSLCAQVVELRKLLNEVVDLKRMHACTHNMLRDLLRRQVFPSCLITTSKFTYAMPTYTPHNS